MPPCTTTLHQFDVPLTAIYMPLAMLGQGWSVSTSTSCCCRSCWYDLLFKYWWLDTIYVCEGL